MLFRLFISLPWYLYLSCSKIGLTKMFIIYHREDWTEITRLRWERERWDVWLDCSVLDLALPRGAPQEEFVSLSLWGVVDHILSRALTTHQQGGPTGRLHLLHLPGVHQGPGEAGRVPGVGGARGEKAREETPAVIYPGQSGTSRARLAPQHGRVSPAFTAGQRELGVGHLLAL